MKVINYQDVPSVASECCVATNERQLTASEAGDQGINMVLFEMEANGYSPLHKHAGGHQIFVLEGDGQVFDGKRTSPIQQGDVLLIRSNEWHQIRNVGASPLRFIAVSPVGGK